MRSGHVEFGRGNERKESLGDERDVRVVPFRDARDAVLCDFVCK